MGEGDQGRHEGPDEERVLPLDALRRAYADLEPAGPERLGEDLEHADPRTRAAIEWMRAGWARLDVPAARPPRGRAQRLAPRSLRMRRLLAAAAAVLLVIALGRRLGDGRRGDAAREDPAPRATARATPASGDASTRSEPRSVDRPPLDGAVRVASVGPDRIELQSGPVRLVLVTGG